MDNKLHADLGDGLIMRTVTSEKDITRIAEAHEQAFGEKELYVITMDCLTKYPGIRWEDILLVEDTVKGQVASSICLLPAQWAYEDVILEVGELGVVGTRKEYQHRGLVRAQMEVFDAKLRSRPYDLGVIQGIPYFYRQFGYEYALPLHPTHKLVLSQIPDLKEGQAETFAVRPLGPEDIPQALTWSQTAAEKLCLHIVRQPEGWLYPEQVSDENPDRVWSYVVEEGSRGVGYFRLHKKKDDFIPCCEMSDMSYLATLAALRHLKRLAQEQGAQGVSLQGPAQSNAVQVARYLGSTAPHRPYAWQIRIPDRARFLQRISPVLERRLAGSMMAGLTESVSLNFYQETIKIEFEEGRITQVAAAGKTDEREVRIPPDIAVRLLTCYESWEEISAYRPDLGARPLGRALMDILFPKRESHIYAEVE